MQKYSAAIALFAAGAVTFNGCKSDSAADAHNDMCEKYAEKFKKVDTQVTADNTAAIITANCKKVQDEYEKACEQFLKKYTKAQRENITKEEEKKAKESDEKLSEALNNCKPAGSTTSTD